MYVIGISAYYHDSSVCLFKHGELVFACEEEKFTGIKHDNSFPLHALRYIFSRYSIKKKDIEAVCYYEDPKLKLERVKKNFKKNFWKSPILTSKALWEATFNVSDIDVRLRRICENVFYSKHHESHIYYSYLTSKFKKAMILSIDGVGESETISVGYANDDDIEIVPLATYPNSIGLFYSAMTAFLGFKPNEGEYKVMGLAPYGDPKPYEDKLNRIISHGCSSVITDMEYFSWDRSQVMFTSKLSKLLGIPNRLPEEELTQEHKNLAAAVQKKYESLFFSLLRDLQIITETTNLCLGGGSAYNGVANGKVKDHTQFKNLWIPMAPSDAGSAIGACLHYFNKNNQKVRVSPNPFLGPQYSTNSIIKALRGVNGIVVKQFRLHSILQKKIAKEIMDGKVVGYYQESIEFGARALGNRSILANPTLPDMKDRINKVIKKREGFRPFAPMVSYNSQSKFFDTNDFIPYMNQVVNVKKEYIDKLPAVTHVDGTARVQSVLTTNRIHNLLKEFEELSGFPILLNTSFNVKDKTMVLTPKDAIETFMDTEMDILVMNNFVIYKKDDKETN
jgi:carbamoyltransferase